MAQSLSKMYAHITFSTKYRSPDIDETIQPKIWAYLAGICNALDCSAIQIWGFNDHIHILCLLSRKISQMKLIEELKKQSSKWMKMQWSQYSSFYRQDGYWIFSVNPTETDKVIQYIQNQKNHHIKQDYKDELLLFLEKYNVDYDAKYLWE